MIFKSFYFDHDISLYPYCPYGLKSDCTSKKVLCVPAPHIEDLVLLPTPVLRLLNVIDDSHLYNEDEYEGEFFVFLNVHKCSIHQTNIFFVDIIEDMKEECQKYGTVVSLLIPKENPGKGQVRP